MTRHEEVTVKMLKDASTWPLGFILPLKRRGLGELGYVVARWDGNRAAPDLVVDLRVRKGNIHSIRPEDPVIGAYDNAEAALADGWLVD